VNPWRHFSKVLSPEAFQNEYHSSSMVDRERDVIEEYVQKTFKQFLLKLEQLKEKLIHGNESPDSLDSRKGILLILYQRVDSLASLFQAQRTLRLEQELKSKEG
jgi:hypothetical protein